MTHVSFRAARVLVAAIAIAALSLATVARAQDEPSADEMKAAVDRALQNLDTQPTDAHAPDHADTPPDAPGEVLDGPDTTLAFKNVTVEEIIPFIVEATGKVVLPQSDILTRRVTVLNDRPIPRRKALDMVFIALLQNQIGVVIRDGTITLRDLAEIQRQDVPVINPDESVLELHDSGYILEKVYSLRYVTSKKFGDAIKNSLPEYAKLTIDEESNQITVLGSVTLLKRVERLIAALDRPSAGAVVTETFRLRYADATVVSQNIQELFPEGNQRRSTTQTNQNNRRQPNNQQQAQSNTQIRVTANTQQNSVTVVADPEVISQIRELVANQWDLPLPDEAVIPRTYDMKNSDPVKVKELLEGLFGKASTTTGNNRNNTQSQGVGRLAGQFSFEAIPESGRLVVVAKSPDNLSVIDEIIRDLDQPQTIGLPVIIELKHASAEDLAEQLNALLAQDGTPATVRRSVQGLSDASLSGSSPFASTSSTANANSDANSAAQTISFWWQRARQQADQRAASNLVGKLRIVPVWRQNAVMVISPPEYRSSITQLVSQLDQPGRQVLLSAIVCEISRDDATELGFRWSSSNISATNTDNNISITNNASGTANNTFAGNLFDTTVLNSSINLNFLLSALAQKTKVNILSEPKIFTSDNEEAEFFDGQDIPFITDSQTNTQGNLVQSFDYKAVGIQLRVRPRITPKKDVDLRVNLELSSIVQGQTLFGGFVVDRRETTTQIIVRDQQTIVISGILRSDDSDVVRKVPLLGDIPLLGYLFRSRDKRQTTTELLVFITPVVVENPEEVDQINAPYRDRLMQRMDEQDPDSTLRTTPKPITNESQPQQQPQLQQ
ncbi:MAG: secretin N-terminal domain-containing protein [Phycisphaerales bacterium]